MSWLFNDRQFLCRALGVAFPDGTRALAVYSPPDGAHPADPGVTKPRTIRAHMGVSGYVVSPYAGGCGQDRPPSSVLLISWRAAKADMQQPHMHRQGRRRQ